MHMARDRFSLAGKVALLIGGTSGIGRQIALGYGEAGARVIPASRSREKIDRTVAEIRSRGGDARGEVVDATDPGQVRDLAARVASQDAKIDILLNCQGMTILKPAEEFTPEDYDTVMETNLKSVFFASV